MIFTKEVASSIVDVFEELLDEKGITIPDDDRTGDDGEARIYGMTYDALLTDVEGVIIELMDYIKTDYKTDTWNEGNWIPVKEICL